MSRKEAYETNRPDGRYLSTLAAQMERLRRLKPELAYDPGMASAEFPAWRERVKQCLRALLLIPEVAMAEAPQQLWAEKRDGYQLEKWEFYPDEFTVVPVLMLIPDSATRSNPAPGIFCLPGSGTSKELLAGEPVPEHPNCSFTKFADRNAQARHLVLNGMVAVAFDNPATAECALNTPQEEGATQWETRQKLSYSLLEYGLTYPGVSVHQKLCFLEWFKTLPFVDTSRLGLSAHSLGTQTALPLALLCDDFTAYVHNDFACDLRRRYAATTAMSREEESVLTSNLGICQIVPGSWRSFGYPDLLAAVAPKFLAINEGGAEEFLNKIRHAYELNQVINRLQITYYPKYADPVSRTNTADIPLSGLSLDNFMVDYSHVDAEDHSYRPEPSVRFFQQSFGKG